MRILLGLVEIAGYYGNLAKGFRELGYACDFIDLKGHVFQYGGDHKPNALVRVVRWLGRQRHRAGELPWPLRLALGGLQELLKLPLLVWAAWRYDVFVFGFHSSFARHWDLPLLKALGKKVICVNHGSDSRPPYLCGSQMAVDRGLSTADCIALTAAKKRTVRWIERYADVVVDHPPSGVFHERAFVSFLALGIPQPEREARSGAERGTDRAAVRLLHAPSHPEAKGTLELRRMVERLRERGYRIEWVEITGQPHHVVVEELRRCDFVVDQLYSDTPMAGLAAEAAVLGKPAAVGGYHARAIHADVPAAMIPPSCFCHPDELEAAIERLIVDETYRLQLGARASRFVAEQWCPKGVAERYLRLIHDRIPADWLCDPRGLSYVHGCGLSEARLRSLVRAVLRTGGPGALCLDDKPWLKAELIRLAETDGKHAEAVLQG